MIAAIVALATTLFLLLHLTSRQVVEEKFLDDAEPSKDVTNGASWYFTSWTSTLDQYGMPFGQYGISLVYALYRRFTVLKVVRYLLFYVVNYIVTSQRMHILKHLCKGISPNLPTSRRKWVDP